MHYEKITTEILEKLKAIVGPKDVVTDADAMQPYSHDEVTDPAYHHMPEAVVFAETAQQVSAIIKLANACHFPVVPRGPARVWPAAPSRNTAASSCRWKR
mgnify:FL=1